MSYSFALAKDSQQISLINLEQLIKKESQEEFNSADFLANKMDLFIHSISDANDEIWNDLSALQKLIPVLEVDHTEIDRLNKLDPMDMSNYIHKLLDEWTLRNNLNSIRDIFSITKSLKSLWRSNRNEFLEKFWLLIKTNLGTNDLRIIFHDLKEEIVSEEKSKSSLVNQKIEGTLSPTISDTDESEDSIINYYFGQVDKVCELQEFNKNNQKLSLLCSINKSPLIIMAKATQYNKLQDVFIHALMDGLQD